MTEPKKRGRPSNAELAARAALQPINESQAYALRVWNGQSESALRPWRIERVRQALEGQGMSMEGVQLP